MPNLRPHFNQATKLFFNANYLAIRAIAFVLIRKRNKKIVQNSVIP